MMLLHEVRDRLSEGAERPGFRIGRHHVAVVIREGVARPGRVPVAEAGAATMSGIGTPDAKAP